MDRRGIEGIHELQEATKRDASPDELREIAKRVVPGLSDDIIIHNLLATRELLERIQMAVIFGAADKEEAQHIVEQVEAVTLVLIEEIESREAHAEADHAEAVEVV